MAYRFRARDRTVDQAVRRIAREQVEGALAAIDKESADVATHEVRKCCKKVRALIRLVRPGFADYSRENAEFRDLARLLAGSRDARVMLDTCDLLIEDAPKGTDPRVFAPVREQIAGELACPAQGDAADTHLDQARPLLKEARERIDGWLPDCGDWDAIGQGLARTLRRARKAERTVAGEPSALHYHELRKLMKYHWYHTRLLVPVWPAMMRPRADELSRLADLLGLHHDICVFEERLCAALPTIDRFDAVEALVPLAGQRRRRLEAEIGPLVARLLAQPPQALAGHWHALWRIWRAERNDDDTGDDTGDHGD